MNIDPVIALGIAVVVILSITSHEAAHGYAADRLGDPTARMLGRLTLNPIPHIDPVFTLALPAILLLTGSPVLFGGAKPVPVNLHNLRSPRRDWAIVGAAGPLANLLLAILMSAIMAFAVHGVGIAVGSALIEILAVGIYFNTLLFVFNLLPIPPLDGSRVVQFFLTRNALAVYRSMENYGLLILVMLLFFAPGMQVLIAALVNNIALAVTGPFGINAAMRTGLGNLLH